MDGGPLHRDRPIAAPFLVHYDEVLRFVTERLGCAQAAADVMQDACVRVLARVDGDEIVHPRAFLYRVANAVLIDHWRRDQSRRQHAAAVRQETRPVAADAQQQVEQQERLREIRRAIDALPDKCREVFRLHRFSGLSYPQIAAQVGISVSTVEKHVIKALAACRAHLAAVESGRGERS
jgi:RNA polymerase sigma-70 factor (ECF subfamily)